MLSPRIREDELFQMTIESNGQAYTFVGYLTATEINLEKDDYDFDINGPYIRGPQRTNITLEIVATSPFTREVLPKKAKRNVQP